MDALHQLEFRISYGDCDPAGIIWYGSYHPWMERLYTDWSFLADARADEHARHDGVTMVSRGSTVSYERAPRVFDQVRCEMRLGAIGHTSYTLRFDFVDADEGFRYALGTITLVTVEVDGTRPVEIPDWLRQPLESAGPAVGLDP